jgi:branched-chain amino acid transport system permease protein
MDALLWIRSILLAVPLAFLLSHLLPIKGPARLPLAIALAWGLSLALIMLLPSGVLAYVVSFAIMGSIFAVLSLGLNVQWGYTGLFNIGIAAFFSIGAFTSALFTTEAPTGLLAQYTQQAFGLDAPFLVGVLAAAIVSGIIAFLIAIPTLRLREDYLAIATIGIAEIIRLVFQNERWLANGPQPLRGIPRPLYCLVENPPCEWLPGPLQALVSPLQPRDYTYIYLVIVSLFVVLVYVALERVIRSPWGRVLRAIREEEDSTAMSGKDIFAFKMQSFVMGSVIMGIGGALYAHYMVSIDYSHFIPLYGTFLIWVMLMLGGSGNNRGAILGAFVIWGVWSGSAFLADSMRPLLAAISEDLPARTPYIRFMLIAILLELILLYRPQGLLGEEKIVSQFAGEK